MTTLLIGVAVVIMVHEAGHAIAAALVGLRIRPFARWNAVGIRVEAPAGGLLPEADLLIALAGPCASVMAAVPLLAIGWHEAAWFSVGLAAENLVPVRVFKVATDGLRARVAIQKMHVPQRSVGV